ncbi:hypothetical protein [Coleofasciculus sp. FACHB-1120]|uniref:hypothetical protein n=1 Tax=Coleofasciculus sp. FACHB-1120 TaxID=2692783 RepID=UPI0016848E67|nr:hypothetical protein [Coleofasciculus sp. FACHB-1120]MBD2740209.1 hypothetical protein [Coleofasciculus sp. FACHB-1120]
MNYTFEILGVSPILYFFNHQQEIIQTAPQRAEYLGSPKCTLDAFLESVEMVPPKRGWNLEEILDTMVDFWLNNSDNIQYWNKRLKDAGKENLLVARVADLKALRAEFDSLLGQNF